MAIVKALNSALTIVQPTSADRSPTTGQPVPIAELLTATANPLVWTLTYVPTNPDGVKISTATLDENLQPKSLVRMGKSTANYTISGQTVTFVTAFEDGQAPYADYDRR